MNAKEYLSILHTAERLKDTPRHCTTAKGRVESVAEHSWRLALMAFLLREEFPELDTDRVIRMCLIHDLGECFTGDIPTFLKTSADRETEDSLLDQWVKSLPAEVSADLSALYREMEAQETMEAKVYKAMDKLEAVIQHNESPLSTWSGNEYELNKTYAFDTVVFSDWLMNLRKEILADTLVKMETEKPLTKENKAGKSSPPKPVRKPEAQSKAAPAKPRTKVAIRRPDRAAWNADGEFGAPVPVPAVPVSVRKTMEAKNTGAEARRNRALVADLERDAMIAVKEADMPTIHFPENDDKYNASRKHKETGKSKDQA